MTAPLTDARQARESLWLGHGHDGLYGDDGEMQCVRCPADYLRDPLPDLIELAMAGVRAALAQCREEREALRQSRDWWTDRWTNESAALAAARSALEDAAEIAELQAHHDTTGIWADRAARWRTALLAPGHREEGT